MLAPAWVACGYLTDLILADHPFRAVFSNPEIIPIASPTDNKDGNPQHYCRRLRSWKPSLPHVTASSQTPYDHSAWVVQEGYLLCGGDSGIGHIPKLGFPSEFVPASSLSARFWLESSRRYGAANVAH
jgi:hypothetical protein